MKLTANGIKAAKPQEKAYKLFDGGGLYLLVSPKGGKSWRLKYRYHRKEQLLTLGLYPDVSLADARGKAVDARRELANGVDPGERKRQERQEQQAEVIEQKRRGTTFRVVAEDWFKERLGDKSKTHQDRTRNLLDRYLYKSIGDRPIDELGAPELKAALRIIEGHGYIDSAHKARSAVTQIFRHAVQGDLIEPDRDPSPYLKGILKPIQKRHLAAITDPNELARLMQDLYRYEGSPIVCAAVKLSAYIPSRPGEIRAMLWEDLDLEAALWEIPGAKMKTGHPHIVPLPRQVVETLQAIHPYTGSGQHVFPSSRGDSRSMSENAVRLVLRALGYDKDTMSAHGFRATFRTVADEILGYPADWIEHQLAHAVRDANGRAYNRTKYLDQRRAMLQAWADYLDLLRDTAAAGDPITRETGKKFAFR